MRKLLLIILLLGIVLVSSVSALSWQEQKVEAKKIALQEHYWGGLRFAYYESFENRYADYSVRGSGYQGKITFYSSSLSLDNVQFKCLVLHEIGHYKDFMNNSEGKLSEDYADSYMLSREPLCLDWQTTSYVGYGV